MLSNGTLVDEALVYLKKGGIDSTFNGQSWPAIWCVPWQHTMLQLAGSSEKSYLSPLYPCPYSPVHPNSRSPPKSKRYIYLRVPCAVLMLLVTLLASSRHDYKHAFNASVQAWLYSEITAAAKGYHGNATGTAVQAGAGDVGTDVSYNNMYVTTLSHHTPPTENLLEDNGCVALLRPPQGSEATHPCPPIGCGSLPPFPSY